jgi:hypothetical protein
MMALTSVIAATQMMGRPKVRRRRRAGRAPVGDGGLRRQRRPVVITRVPDIVVTLAMAFVWAGFALLVAPRPGVARSAMAQGFVIGPIGNE